MAYEFLKAGVVDRVGWIEYQRPVLATVLIRIRCP